MSLSTILKEENVKRLFSNYIQIPKVKFGSQIKAEPLTKRYGLIGTAFDYLFRFSIEQTNKNIIAQNWTAEISAKSEYFGKNSKARKHAFDIIDRALNLKNLYVKNGKITNELLIASINLAYIDTIYRSKKAELADNFIKDSRSIDENDIQDLKNLHSILDLKKFKSKSVCALNPTFGDASILVNGADADIFIDETLIDIKTVKNIAITSEYMFQLIGYFLLSKLDKIDEVPKKYTIKNVGIYFSRYGELITFPVEQLLEMKKLDEFKKAFTTEINKIK